MLKLNHEEIKKKEKELTFFRGWLPFRFLLFIDLTTRFNWLKAEGLYEKYQKENAYYKYKLMNAENEDAMMDALIMKFIDENPRFKDIITLQ